MLRKSLMGIGAVSNGIPRLVAIALMAAGVCRGETAAPAFENCRPIGPAQVWDFTQGLPAGARLRTDARLVPGVGLTAVASTNDVPAGCTVAKYEFPEAFRLDVEFVPPAAENPPAHRAGVLLDTLYVTYHRPGFEKGLQLGVSVTGDMWTPHLCAGFGMVKHSMTGPSTRLAPGMPTTLSLFFDAGRGVQWNFAGETSSVFFPGGTTIAPSRFPLTLGDRVGSCFAHFPGTLRRVAVTPCARSPFVIAQTRRTVFERGESAAQAGFEIENRTGSALTQLQVACTQKRDGRVLKTMTRPLDAAAARATVDIDLETRIPPGTVDLEVEVTGRTAAGAEVRVRRSFPLVIAPRFADRMPTAMWHFTGAVSNVANFGFTHATAGFGWHEPLGDAAPAAAVRAQLDTYLATGLRAVKHVNVAFPTNRPREAFLRTTRTGTIPKQSPAEVSNPELVAHARRLARENVDAYGRHPAFGGVLTCSEMRDHTMPSFTTEAARYQAETGREVPAEVGGRVWNRKWAAARFPDGVVPVDDPVLAYYRWFWHGGDGWPGYTGAIAEEYRQGRGTAPVGSAGDQFFSFFDPAVRCPPCWGSGGNVDVISQWIYAVPEPMNVAGPLEEMFAMAAGRPGQDVMMMTQLICYRAQIAPSNVVVNPAPAWVQRRPLADFPSIPPDSLQEATWCMLAKPVKGIMYHGWGCIFETGNAKGYTFTNEETPKRLTSLLKELVAPLGPTLKRLGRADSPVAILESATTCFMGGPASWGWSAPAVTFFQRARLDPRVVYEETILRDGLDGVRVLYAPQCQFLTPDVVAKIRAFQRRGGILIGDGEMLKALQPDLVVPVVSFSAPPESDHTADVEAMEAAKTGDGNRRAGTVRAKAVMQRQADELRAALAPKYRPATDSSSTELLVFNRRWRTSDYVFAINDKRTFGDYVGMWGMTMEKGLPFRGWVRKADPARTVAAVYELSRGGEVPFTRAADGTLEVSLDYATNDGRLLLFAPQKIASLAVEAPAKVMNGTAFEVTLRVLDAAHRPVAALLPVEIRVFDPSGRELDGAGFGCAVDGGCTMRIQTNVDAPMGSYRLVCRDRASGLACTRSLSAAIGD